MKDEKLKEQVAEIIEKALMEAYDKGYKLGIEQTAASYIPAQLEGLTEAEIEEEWAESLKGNLHWMPDAWGLFDKMSQATISKNQKGKLYRLREEK